MSDASSLFNADLREEAVRRQRYWRSSSVPAQERRRHQPGGRTYRRDRVLARIMARQMEVMLTRHWKRNAGLKAEGEP